jgi:hypothetical protein
MMKLLREAVLDFISGQPPLLFYITNKSMKQKKNGLIGCLLVFTGLMAACTELEEPSSSMQEKISITGTLDGFSALHSTRTQVGGMAENGALFMEWSVGDRVCLVTTQ